MSRTFFDYLSDSFANLLAFPALRIPSVTSLQSNCYEMFAISLGPRTLNSTSTYSRRELRLRKTLDSMRLYGESQRRRKEHCAMKNTTVSGSRKRSISQS